MANHKSSLKRIRQEQKRRLHNRYYAGAQPRKAPALIAQNAQALWE